MSGLTVLSQLPESAVRPLGANAMEVIGSECPSPDGRTALSGS